MELVEERQGDVCLLRVIGRAEGPASKDLEEKILSLIAAGREKLVIDLSRLDYVGSMGLRAFLLASRRVDEAKGKLVLCSLQDAVRQIFDLAGFSSYLTIAGSTEEAVKMI